MIYTKTEPSNPTSNTMTKLTTLIHLYFTRI